MARVIDNRQENKLAGVLVHILAVKKYINSFGKFGLEGLQLSAQNTDNQKSRVEFRHREGFKKLI